MKFIGDHFMYFVGIVGVITFILQKRKDDKWKPFINTGWVIGLLLFTKNIFTPQLLTDTFSE